MGWDYSGLSIHHSAFVRASEFFPWEILSASSPSSPQPQLKYHFLGEMFCKLLTKSNPSDPLSPSNSLSFITPIMMATVRVFVCNYLNIDLTPKIS